MAIAAPPLPARRSYTPVQLWHLLSLDAPTVAVTWTLAASLAAHRHLRPSVLPAMFVAVWLLYVADRLLDFRDGVDLEARHRFHGHNLKWLLPLSIAAIALLAWLITGIAPTLLRDYLLLTLPLILYFALIHLTPLKRFLPKEAIVAIFFSAAIFMPELHTLRIAALAALFGAICWLNCIAIHRWEADSPIWGARNLRALCLITCTLSLTLAFSLPLNLALLSTSCAISSALLIFLDIRHYRLSAVTLRAAADLVLLTPLPLLLFLR